MRCGRRVGWVACLVTMTACNTGDVLLGNGDANVGGLAFEGGSATRDAAVATASSTSPETVIAVSEGNDSACALTASGGVQCWGDNTRGHLGNNSTVAYSTVPVPVSGLATGVTAISVGNYSACALTASGGVQCWGDDEFGQLGNSSIGGYSAVPVPVSGLATGVAAISVGNISACALTTNGGVQCWGAHALGNNSASMSPVPVPVTGLERGAVAVAVGSSSACAITTDGGVQCWGSDSQLGLDPTARFSVPVPVMGLTGAVSAVSVGDGSACAIAVGGRVECWGQIAESLLSSGPSGPASVAGLSTGVMAVSVGSGHACAVAVDGQVECWGDTLQFFDAYPPMPVTGLERGVTDVSVGGSFDCAVAAGRVECWGDNLSGELGNGSPLQGSWDPVPVTGLGVGSAPASGAGDTSPEGPGDASDERDSAKAGCADPLTFADPDVESTVRQEINLPSGPIHAADVASLFELMLYLPNNPAYDAPPTFIDYVDPPQLDDTVTSLAGVECIPSLHTIAVNPNLLDLTPLGRLPNLNQLDFTQTFESTFPYLPHVNWLHATVYFSSNTEAILSACPSLRVLYLNKADLTTAKARAALSALTGLTRLSLPSAGLTDTAPLAPLTLLTDVDLDTNQIRDISSLSALPNLRSLDLSGNQITDLAPLVANYAIGSGTAIAIASNPIDCAAQQQNIATLRARGVTILTDCP